MPVNHYIVYLQVIDLIAVRSYAKQEDAEGFASKINEAIKSNEEVLSYSIRWLMIDDNEVSIMLPHNNIRLKSYAVNKWTRAYVLSIPHYNS